MKQHRSDFDILGVTPADDMATIRMAWRAKVRELHPDVAGNSAGSTERLMEVNAAFDALQGHEPSARARARKQADLERRAQTAELAARAAACRRAEERARLEAVQKKQRAAALERAKAAAIKARLKAHMGTVHARAANGYAAARKILVA